MINNYIKINTQYQHDMRVLDSAVSNFNNVTDILSVINEYGLTEDIYNIVNNDFIKSDIRIGEFNDPITKDHITNILTKNKDKSKKSLKEVATNVLNSLANFMKIKASLDASNSSKLYILYKDKLDNIDIDKSKGVYVKGIDIDLFNKLIKGINKTFQDMKVILSYPIQPIPRDRLDYNALDKFKLQNISLYKSGYLGEGKLNIVKKLSGGIMHHGKYMMKLLDPLKSALNKKVTDENLKDIILHIRTANKQFNIKEQMIMLGYRSMSNIINNVKTK